MSDLKSILLLCMHQYRVQQLRDIGKQRIFEYAHYRWSYSCNASYKGLLSFCASLVASGNMRVKFVKAFPVHRPLSIVEQCVSTPTLFHSLSHIERPLPVLYCTCPSSSSDAPRYGEKHLFQLSHSLWDRLQILPQVVALFHLAIVPARGTTLDTENKADRILA